MGKYRKLIVALVGAGAIVAQNIWGLPVDPEIAVRAGETFDAVMALLTAAGVFAVPNQEG